jgi:hypothetical protein
MLDALRHMASKDQRDSGRTRHIYAYLADLHRANKLDDDTRDAFARERLIYVPDRIQPFVRIQEVVWEIAVGMPGFPALSTHYPALRDFFLWLGVRERATAEWALNILLEIGTSRASSATDKLRLEDAYRLLAITPIRQETEWTLSLEEFKKRGQVLCRYDLFRDPAQAVVPDDPQMVAIFDRDVGFIWLPDVPLDKGRLADVLALQKASDARREVSFERGSSNPASAAVDGCRRALVGYIAKHPLQYLELSERGLLSTLAAGPIVSVRKISIRYVLVGQEKTNEAGVAAYLDEARIYLTEDASREEIARDFEKCLVRIPGLEEVLFVLMGKSSAEREQYARDKHYHIDPQEWQRLLLALKAELVEEDVDEQLAESPAVIVHEDKEQSGPTNYGVKFVGRTHVSVPHNSDQQLRDRLRSKFPRQREAIARYLNDTDPEQSPEPTITLARADEEGVVRSARTVLRQKNLDQAYLQFNVNDMRIFNPADQPREVLLISDDEHDTILAYIDYERGILHARPEKSSKSSFVTFLESYAIQPGAYLSLDSTADPERFHLHPIWQTDMPQVLTEVSYSDFDTNGCPVTLKVNSVSLPYLVDEGVYRYDFACEQRAAAWELIKTRGIGVLTEVFTVLENADEDGLYAGQIHRLILESGHTCAMGSVLGALYAYECFEHMPDGRWQLIEKPRDLKPGYQRLLEQDEEQQLPDDADTTEATQNKVENVAPQVRPKQLLSEGDTALLERHLATIRNEDQSEEKREWRYAVKALAQLFTTYHYRLEGALAHTIATNGANGPTPPIILPQQPVQSASKTGVDIDRDAAVVEAIETARKYVGRNKRAALAAAIAGWIRSTTLNKQQLKSDALLALATALRDVHAYRLAANAYTQSGRQSPQLDTVRTLALNSSAPEERRRIYDDIERGRKFLVREHREAFTELIDIAWSKASIDKLPS